MSENNYTKRLIKDESPKLSNYHRRDQQPSNSRADSNGMRRGSGNSQSRDAIPIARDYAKNYLEQRKDVIRSNENISATSKGLTHYNSTDRLGGGGGRITPRKYEEEKKQPLPA